MSEKAKQRKPNRNMPIEMLDEKQNIIQTFESKQAALKFLGVVCYSPLNKALDNGTIYKNYYWKYQNIKGE